MSEQFDKRRERKDNIEGIVRGYLDKVEGLGGDSGNVNAEALAFLIDQALPIPRICEDRCQLQDEDGSIPCTNGECQISMRASSSTAATMPLDLDHTPGDIAELIEMLRRLFDKTADAHDGDYPAKVGHALLAVYAYGKRNAAQSASGRTDEAAIIARRWLDYVDKKVSFYGLAMTFAEFTTVCRALLGEQGSRQ